MAKDLSLSVDTLKDLIVQSLDTHKAEHIKVIDLKKRSALADYMVIATGISRRHLEALDDYLERELKDQGIRPRATEGAGASDWVVLDYGDVIVHLFLQETRDLYAIEHIWEESEKEKPRKGKASL